MAILTKEEFFERLNELVGEENSDDALQIIEDFTDTYNNFETQTNENDNENWKERYEQLDTEWRQKYRERFFSSDTSEDVKDDVTDDTETKNFEDLFEERNE